MRRNCVICGKELKISVKNNKSYSGGHYFGVIDPFEAEYWECDGCYVEWPK